jgi:hypothetical protein
VLPFDDSNKSDIHFGDYNSDFKDGFDFGKDNKLDLEEDIILLEDNNSPSNSDSKLEEGTSFVNIKEYLAQMSFIKPLILAPAKIPKIPSPSAPPKAHNYYNDETRI